jgi:hypothetical protein
LDRSSSAPGLFVDIEKTFLGASPDGLVNLNSIVEIKCPFAARNTDIETAIEKKDKIFKNGSQG